MQRKPKKTTEQGLSLIESLVGIMIITVVISFITPALVMGYASRVKNYRTDQAIKIARGEIDRVRLEVERIGDSDDPNKIILKLPPVRDGENITTPAIADLKKVTAPDNITLINQAQATPCPLTNVKGNTSEKTVCGVDINGDGRWDLGVQTFRSGVPSSIQPQAGGKPVAFLMGVRVYTRAALEGGNLKKIPDNPDTSVGNLGLTSGQNLSVPLVTYYVPIVKSDKIYSREAYCEMAKALNNDTQTDCEKK